MTQARPMTKAPPHDHNTDPRPRPMTTAPAHNSGP